jgi:hypothetical protein
VQFTLRRRTLDFDRSERRALHAKYVAKVGGHMANNEIVTQFRGLSTINKIALGLAGFNAIALILVVVQLMGFESMKSDLESAIYDASDRQITLTCDGTYSGEQDYRLRFGSYDQSGNIRLSCD